VLPTFTFFVHAGGPDAVDGVKHTSLAAQHSLVMQNSPPHAAVFVMCSPEPHVYVAHVALSMQHSLAVHVSPLQSDGMECLPVEHEPKAALSQMSLVLQHSFTLQYAWAHGKPALAASTCLPVGQTDDEHVSLGMQHSASSHVSVAQ
jgi:hypothetical protein